MLRTRTWYIHYEHTEHWTNMYLNTNMKYMLVIKTRLAWIGSNDEIQFEHFIIHII